MSVRGVVRRGADEAGAAWPDLVRRPLAVFVSCLALIGASPSSGDEHAAHHAAPGSSAPGGPPAMGTAGGMGEMMREMGKPPRQELYPSLMNLPALSPTDRAEMQRLAHERMQTGIALLSTSLSELSAAADEDDYAAMQAATGGVREGLRQFEDGIAAHRALAEGKRPGGVALDWFRQNLDLERPAVPRQWTVLGLSPMHLLAMLLLVAFALATIGVNFLRMRRAATLLARLTTTPPSGGSPAEPAGSPPPAAPAPPSGGAAATGAGAPNARAGTTRWAGALRIARIVQETPIVKTFRLVAAGGGPIPFAFLPGQFLNVALTIDGALVRRSFTIASSPSERGWLELTIKREDRGLVSRHLHDKVRQGDSLQVNAPFGTFTFTGREAGSVVLVAAGVGVTPVMSVLRYLVAIAWAADIYFLYCVRTSADVIFRDELEQLAQRCSTLHLTLTATRPDERWKGLTGRLTKDVIAAAVPELSRRRIHVCGPSAMMSATKAMLLQLGVPAPQIKMEDFGSPAPPPAPAVVIVPDVPVAPAAGPRVEFTRSHKTTSVAGRTVLEASEAVAVDIPWSCRVGTCGVCKSHLVAGNVTMAVEDGLEPGDRERGMILACQARAIADVAVEA